MANRRKKRGRDGEDDETENEAPRACLPLDDSVEDDTTRPPMNGDEYLRRVRAEAKKCPAVMVAKNRDSILRESQRKAQRVAPPGRTLAEHLVPNAAWRRATLGEFIHLRGKMRAIRSKDLPAPPKPTRAVPADRDSSHWKSFCLGKSPAPPTVDVMLCIDQLTLSWLVICHKNWLCNSPVAPTGVDVAAYSAKEANLVKMCYQAVGNGVSGSLSWLYAVLVCLEQPLRPADQTALAELQRSLCLLWNQIDAWGLLSEEGRARSGVPVKNLDVDKLVGLIAALVTVTHSYFRQGNAATLWPYDVVSE